MRWCVRVSFFEDCFGGLSYTKYKKLKMISETIQDQFEPPAIGPLELHSKCAALGVLRSEIMSKNVFISGGQFSPYKSVLQG